MKNILKGITFWTIFIAFIIVMLGIGQALANLITMETIMTVVYVALGYGITYMLKN